MLDRKKDEESAKPAPETAPDNDDPKSAAEPAYVPTPATPKPPAPGLSGMSAIPRRLADIPQGDFWTSAPPAWLDGYLSAAALAPLAPRPGVWLSAVAERDRGMGDDRTLEQFLSLATGRYNELLAGLGEGRFGAAMLAGLGDGDLTAWARGFAQGVRVLEDVWLRREFQADDRRALSLIAALAGGEPPDETSRGVLAEFIDGRAAIRHNPQAVAR